MAFTEQQRPVTDQLFHYDQDDSEWLRFCWLSCRSRLLLQIGEDQLQIDRQEASSSTLALLPPEQHDDDADDDGDNCGDDADDDDGDDTSSSTRTDKDKGRMRAPNTLGWLFQISFSLFSLFWD